MTVLSVTVPATVSGAVLPAGPQGPQGVPGATGPQGLPGPTGPAGIQGIAGPMGLSVLSGAAAPDGTVGQDGSFYVQTAGAGTPLFYGPRAGGAWPAGVPIQGMISGSGAPSGAVGVDGQYYVDGAALVIYGPKASGAWPAGVSIAGSTGPAPLLPVAAWQTGTAYVAGPPASFVQQGGSSYECLASHTAGTFATDLAAGKWGLVAAKGADGSLGTGGTIDGDLTMDRTSVSLTRQIKFATGNLLRWALGFFDTAAESGSNAGGNYALDAYSDAGSFLGRVFSIARATQVLTFNQSPIVPTETAGDNSNKVASTAYADAAVAAARMSVLQSDILTASGTWTKNANAKVVRVVMIGGGGGGLSGTCGNGGTNRSAGTGGGPGAVIERWYNAVDLGSTETVTVGAGGNGGAASTSGTNPGQNGGASSFGVSAKWGAAPGGTGAPSTISSGVAGIAITVSIGGTSFSVTGGGAQGPGSKGSAPYLCGGPGAGGGGSGLSSSNTAGIPAAGGAAWDANGGGYLQSFGALTGGGGSAAASDGAAGGAGAAGAAPFFGAGGGGGYASVAGPGGAGGDGGAPGGGGGGGGSAVTGQTSGKGGNGGRGEVRIYQYG